MTCKTRPNFLTFILCLAILPASTFADVVQSIGVSGTGSGNGTLPYSSSVDVLGSGSLLGSGSGNGNGTTSAASFGQIFSSGSGSALGSLTTSVFSDRAGGFVPKAIAGSAIVYGDDIFLSGSAPLPSTVRVHFGASGNLDTSFVNTSSPQSVSQAQFLAQGSSLAGAYSELGVDALAGVEDPDFGTRLAFLDYTRDFDVFPSSQSTKTTTEGWSNLNESGSLFNGEFFFDVNYDAAINGYDFEVLLRTRSRSGFSIADSSVSIELLGVTDTLNNEFTNFDVSFASGRLAAVPEPNTVLLCSFAIGLAVCQRRRKSINQE